MILEHVNKKQGEEYLFKLSKYSSNLTQFQDKAISLSRIGNPRVFDYESLGKVSPTILRYLATAAEINHLFDFKDSNIVTEIGIGYAGQLATLSSIIGISEYNAYDVACVQELSRNFLSESGEIESNRLIVCKDIYNVESHESDLFISNYAFSELPIQIQEEYLLKLATKSEYGYMIMNSGLVNRTGRSSGKMSVQMIRDIIPKSKIYPESPLTGPDNYLLTWGNTRDPIL
jgi:hypothetical protein